MKSENVYNIDSKYGHGISFWAFEHENGNITLKFDGDGQCYSLQGIGRNDAIRVAACIMRLFGGDVYELREDCESEVGND